MHKYFLSTFFVFCCLFARSQRSEPWNNTTVFSQNKEKYHVQVIPFDELNDALNGDIKKSPNYLSINGIWKFKQFASPKDTSIGFYKPGTDVQTWDNISVPGFIDLLAPEQKAIDPGNSNPVGIYRTIVMLPTSWGGREVFINFDGVSSAFILWVNGQQVGYSENSYSPSEFNITRYLKQGENILTVEVFKYSDGSYLENYNNEKYGIFRDVYLYTTPRLQIRDYKVETDFDESYNNATIKIKGEVRNLDKKDLYKYSVEFALYDAKNKLVFSEKSPLFSFAKTKSKTKGVAYEKLINAPQKWNSENPYLYTLVITMRSDKEKILEILTNKVGFKEVDKRNDVIYLNDKRLIIKGIQVNEYTTGNKTFPSEESMKQDIFFLKRNNLNTVYCNHPFSPIWYNLCDKYGIYVCNQANLNTTNNTDGFDKDTAWTSAFMDRCYSLFERDKNHPSVITWSIGNIKDFDFYQTKISLWIETHDEKSISINKTIASRTFPSMLLIDETSAQRLATKLKNEKRPVISLYNAKKPKENEVVDSLFRLTHIYSHFHGLLYTSDSAINSNTDIRLPHKIIFQPVSIRFSDTLFNKIYIKNLHETKNLNTYNVVWELKDSKNNTQSGLLKPDIPASEEKEITIPYKKILNKGQYTLSIYFRLADTFEWANKGFEVSNNKLKFVYDQKKELLLK